MDGVHSRGGSDVGELGDGYCVEGYHGPLCQLCDAPREHFDVGLGRCDVCPTSSEITRNIVVVAIGIIVLSVLITVVYARMSLSVHRGPVMRRLIGSTHRIVSLGQRTALIPKLKLLIAFYQSLHALPEVYAVSLPDYYYEWSDFLFSWIDLDWASLFIPASCISSGCMRGGPGPSLPTARWLL